MDLPHVFIESRSKPICDVPKISKGCQPTDGGNLIIENTDYEDFIKREPNAQKYIKKLIGAKEFINNTNRYCLWLVNVSPKEINSMPLVKERIAKVREMRLASSDKGTHRLAETPHLFRETYNPKTYIVVPSTTSERRNYVPLSFFDENTISTNANLIIPEANLYHYGILTSSVHMAWMRVVAGRLKSDYRYSKDIVYNNFIWITATEQQKEQISKTAQAILDARKLYPDSSLADLYDPLLMPLELRKAHKANDKAVLALYGFKPDASEEEIVAKLMQMYAEKVKGE